MLTAEAPVNWIDPVTERLSPDDRRWEAVMARDRHTDGRFVYAVVTTGVFCLPSCASRRPRRENVTFFADADSAVQAGYRPCKRCRPTSADRRPTSADAVAHASRFLTDHADESISLARLAQVTGSSPWHLQRQFRRTLGVSPRQFQAARRAERFRAELRAGRDVAGAIYEAGYGSPSRVYEAPPTGKGIPPASYRQGGAGAHIGYQSFRCELGWLLVAATLDGVCAVKLGERVAPLEADLRREFPAAKVTRGRFVRREWVAALLARVRGAKRAADLPLDVRGTAFQWRVWQALQRIPLGARRSYSEVAVAIGQPRAARAVAHACAANPVCLAVPCHRVVPKGGATGGYRWGAKRKARLLERESKRTPTRALRPARD